MAPQNELEKGEVSPRNILLHGNTVHQAPIVPLSGLVNLAMLKEDIMIDIQIIGGILSGLHHDETEAHQEAGALPGTGGGVVAGALLATEMGVAAKALATEMGVEAKAQYVALAQRRGGQI